jgi:actin-related protein 6
VGAGRGGDGADEQVLALGVERFATGEVLFHPADIGLDEAGMPEAIVQAVNATLPDLHEALYSNILLTGGTTLLPNFSARLETELRQLVPADFALNVRAVADPIVAAWRGASRFASGPLFERSSVSREEYLEHGHSFVRRVCHN